MTEFRPDMLPPQPEIIPPDLRASVDNTGWATKIPPEGVGMFIAFIVQTLSHPRFGAKVNVDPQPGRWVIEVELRQPELRDDIDLH